MTHKEEPMAILSRSTTSPIRSLLLVLLLIAISCTLRFAGGGKIHIPDELDDVVDVEEDDAWKEWGKKSTSAAREFDPPPDFSDMDIAQIQAEMMKRQFGPSFGFVKLRLGVRRTPDMISEIAMKWSKISRTGAIDAKFMGVDVSTIMFTLEKGQDTIELKEFLLSQPEVYEVKIGDQLFRRPGDLPFDVVFDKLRGKHESEKEDLSQKDEL